MQKAILLFLSLVQINMLQAETPVVEKQPVEEAAEKVTDGSLLSKAIQPRAEAARWMYLSTYFEEGKKVPGGSSREEVIQVKEIDGVACYQIKLTMD